jgi:hypothetical protein
MTSCKKYQPLIAAHWFGDLAPHEEDALGLHVQTCAACRAALESGAETLKQLGKPAIPEMPSHFWDGYWSRLTHKMETAEKNRRASIPAKLAALLQAKWSPAFRLAATAAIFLAGVLLSRVLWPPEKPTAEISSPSAPPLRATLASSRADDLLSRSKVLLIGFANLDPAAVSSGEFDIALNREISRKLMTEAAAFRNDPGTGKDRQLLQLINQLEMVLLQIAHLELEHDAQAVELVRSSIDRQGLLLKINIEEMKRLAVASDSKPAPSL